LFNYLHARNRGGKFLLRIEDTDRERSKEEYTKSILEGFEWFGTNPDEPPIHQSERTEYHREIIQRLLDAGKAYPCDLTKEQLDEMRKKQVEAGETPRYDGHSRDRKDVPVEGSVIRLRTPDEGSITVNDPIYGSMQFNCEEIEDFVIAKSDGLPTYQLAVVADDHAQGVTLVIRGNDLLPSTPKQILIYEALGWEPPVFAHLPMILGTDKQKLSKRHGATSLLAYRAMGYLPQAMRNYLVRLGWAHGDQEVFDLEEMIEKFSLEDIGKSPAVFNAEKLLWLNGEHIRKSSIPELTDAWLDHLRNLESDWVYMEASSEEEIPLPRIPNLEALADPAHRAWLERLVASCQERSSTLVQITDYAWPFLAEEIEYDPKAVSKVLKPAAKDPLERVLEWITGLDKLPSEEGIHDYLVELAEGLGLNLGKVAQPIRVALTGSTVSPPINTTIALMGKEKSIQRIAKALEFVPETEGAS
jgi:glutamyl-tRNA synthetase